MSNFEKPKFLHLNKYLNLSEVYTIGILTLYTLLSLIFFGAIKGAFVNILTNTSVILALISIAYYQNSHNKYKYVKLLRKLFVLPFVLLIYSQVQDYIPILNPYNYDKVLAGWDYLLFGLNPTFELHKISFPALTEYLQFSYMSYYFMPILFGLEYFFFRSDREFDYFARSILFAYYISYILYFFMPAIGPRFELHNFASLSTDLPGVWLTEHFRAIVNLGGGVPVDSTNASSLVNSDCMPSGHTMITLVCMFIAFKLKSNMRFFYLILGSSLIFSTVYLRYHYVVDVIVGIILALLVFLFEPKLKNIIGRYSKSNFKKN